MSTPIERAAEAVDAELKRPGNRSLKYSRKRPERIARAALTAALDPEWLGDLIAEQRDAHPRRSDDMDSEELATAIIAHILSEGDQT